METEHWRLHLAPSQCSETNRWMDNEHEIIIIRLIFKDWMWKQNESLKGGCFGGAAYVSSIK